MRRGCVGYIDKTNITFYKIDDGILSAIAQFMQESSGAHHFARQVSSEGNTKFIKRYYSGQYTLACRCLH